MEICENNERKEKKCQVIVPIPDRLKLDVALDVERSE